MSIRRNVRKAFTLIEILIVVVILGILAAIVVPQFTDASNDANASAGASMLQTLQSQVELFRAQTGGYPATLGDLVTNNYLRSIPTDPTGTGAAGVGAASWTYPMPAPAAPGQVGY